MLASRLHFFCTLWQAGCSRLFVSDTLPPNCFPCIYKIVSFALLLLPNFSSCTFCSILLYFCTSTYPYPHNFCIPILHLILFQLLFHASCRPESLPSLLPISCLYLLIQYAFYCIYCIHQWALFTRQKCKLMNWYQKEQICI